jgi:hypothetical protein
LLLPFVLQVLGKLDALVKEWVRRVSASKGFTEPLLSEVRAARARAGQPARSWARTAKRRTTLKRLCACVPPSFRRRAWRR